MKQKIDTEIYAEKTIATYETKYRDNPLSKPQEIVLTITSGHLYGKAFVCEQVATKEEDIFYSKFSASISDIANITINTYIKEYPIYISFEKPSKDNKYAKDRKRIILPSFENPENIVAQITETKERLEHTKKKKPEVTEEQFALDYSETPKAPKKSGIDDIINIWDNVSTISDETVEIKSESEVIVESIEEQAGSLEIESEVNFTEEADEFIEEELLEEIRTPPIAPAPPAFMSETVFEADEAPDEADETPENAEEILDEEEFPEEQDEPVSDAEESYGNSEETEIAEEVLFETVRTAVRAEIPANEPPETDLLYSDDEDEKVYGSNSEVFEDSESDIAEPAVIPEPAAPAPPVAELKPAVPTPSVTEPASAVPTPPVTEPASAAPVQTATEPAPAAPVPPVTAPAPAASSGAKLSSLESFEESMKKLKIMYEAGVITIEEFNAEKKNILKTLY